MASRVGLSRLTHEEAETRVVLDLFPTEVNDSAHPALLHMLRRGLQEYGLDFDLDAVYNQIPPEFHCLQQGGF
jgi:hypothetical protein